MQIKLIQKQWYNSRSDDKSLSFFLLDCASQIMSLLEMLHVFKAGKRGLFSREIYYFKSC